MAKGTQIAGVTYIKSPMDANPTNGNSSNTVSSDGVFDALANKADENDVVHDTGNETISGVKTFSSFPVTPSAAPSTDYQVANRKFVLDNVGSTKQGLVHNSLGSTLLSNSASSIIRLNSSLITSSGTTVITPSSSNSRLTANRTCLVMISFSGYSNTSGQFYDIYKNGSFYCRGSQQNGATFQALAVCNMYLTNTQYFEIYQSYATSSTSYACLTVTVLA